VILRPIIRAGDSLPQLESSQVFRLRNVESEMLFLDSTSEQ
jgi:hypothetical protein